MCVCVCVHVHVSEAFNLTHEIIYATLKSIMQVSWLQITHVELSFRILSIIPQKEIAALSLRVDVDWLIAKFIQELPNSKDPQWVSQGMFPVLAVKLELETRMGFVIPFFSTAVKCSGIYI